MLTCSDEVQHVYRFARTAKGGNNHPTEIPLHSMTFIVRQYFHCRKSSFCSTKHRNNGSRPSSFSPCIERRNFRNKYQYLKTATSKDIARATKTWMAAWVEWCKARSIKKRIISHHQRIRDCIIQHDICDFINDCPLYSSMHSSSGFAEAAGMQENVRPADPISSNQVSSAANDA